MKNRLIIIGADFSANALVGQIETSYSLRVDVESVEVSRTTPATIYATSELQTFNDDVYVGSTPAPISVSATGGLIATVGTPEGNVYPITLDASAVTQEICKVTITQIGTSNIATVEAICQIYAVKRATNAPLMDVVYAQGWSASPDYMTFAEAAAVTTFGKVFNDNTEIDTFNEAQYFTGLTTLANAFQGSMLRSINLANLQSVKSYSYAFYKCTQLETLVLEGVNSGIITTMMYAFQDCFSLKRIDMSSWEDTSSMTGNQWMLFAGCSALEEINLPANFAPKATGYGYMLWYVSYPNLRKITGWFNAMSISASNVINIDAVPSLRQIEMRNIGTQSALTACSWFKDLTNWGINSTEVPDARQSLKNTFDYLFDRASAGYDACTITLSANTLNELIDIFGDDGMLAIINKGYTIANYTPAG